MNTRRLPVFTLSNPLRKIILFPILLITLSLACSLPVGGTPTPIAKSITGTPTITPTPNPLPPDLVESDPPQGVEVPLEGPLTFYFNQPMDRASVEAAFVSQFEQEITFSWMDDSSVMLFLSQPLEPESELALDLGDKTRSAQGLGVIQPISLKYQTAGYLHLTQSLPKPDTSNVDPSSAITAAFNRPVVPIGAEQDSLPEAFTLEPSAQGRAEWINSSTFIFYPDPSLQGGIEYTVSINKQLKSTDGGPLQNIEDWSFTTAFPHLESIEPTTEIPWRLDAEVVLTFNQPMDPASLENNFSLNGPDGGAVPGSGAWEQDFTRFTFTPDDLLKRDSEYFLRLSGDVQANGGTPLGGKLEVSVITVPSLTIYQTDPAPGGSIDPLSSIGLLFSSPLPKTDQSTYISIQPQIETLNNWWDEELQELRIGGLFEPSTKYTLTISTELNDIWGGNLEQDYQLNFSTQSLSPNLTIPVPSEMIFLTPQESSIAVQAVNLPAVPVIVGEVPLLDFQTMMGPEGYEMRSNYQNAGQTSWRQSLDLQLDRTKTVDLYLTPDQSPLPPGIYFLRFDLDDTQFYAGTYLLAVSNIQMTLKTSSSDALVWAVDLRDGSPLPNAPVTIYSEDGTELASGISDTQGVFKTTFETITDPYLRIYAITGQPGQENFGVALTGWNQGVTPWDFGLTANPDPPGLKVYYYTDRPIYRPGQNVYFRAVARQANNTRYTLPNIDQLPITLSGPESEVVSSLELPLSAFGSVHGEYSLPADAQPGYYTLFTTDLNDPGVQFQVANYRKPEINLQVEFTSKKILAGESLQANISTRYFFDEPVGNLPINWALYASPQSFSLSGYQVGLVDTSWLDAFWYPDFSDQLGELVLEGAAETNAEGLLSLDFPTEPGDEYLRYTLEVTLEDESGLPVSGRDVAGVHPDSFYIGLRPDSWTGRAGEEAGFDLLVADWNKKPAGIRNLKAEFKKVTWIREDPPTERSYEPPTFTAQYTAVGSTVFSTNEEGQARLSFIPPEPGTYLLDVTSPVAAQGSAHSQILLWIGGPGQPVWPNIPNSRLRLTADQDSYLPGETAQVFIPNPFGSEVPALVTIERSIVMEHQVITLPSGGQHISLPMSAQEAPNVYVSTTLLGQNAQGRPDFRQGYLNLPVEPVEQTLQVALSSQPERIGPGDEVQIEVQVSDFQGKPVQGEFSLAVVDLAALVIAEPNAPGIVEAFYSQSPNGVNTSLSLAAYSYRLINLPGGLGGGGAFAEGMVVRESFPDTAFWNAEVVTGADGKAQISLKLPDSLTTWVIDTRGTTSDTLVGEAQEEIFTSKDLLVRPATPRFFVVGDHSLISAVVNNNSDETIQAEVSLQANGMELDDASLEIQSVHLPPKGRARVEWWGTVQDVESVDLVFSVQGSAEGSGNKYQDAARPLLGALPVIRFIAPQTFRTSGTMDEGGEITELISLPRSFEAQGSLLDVELSPSLAAAMMNSLEVLESDPYESTEQILSSFLPNLETFRSMQQFGIQAEALQTRLDQTLNQGLTRLQARQNPDMGWGWWQGSESDPYITAYVLFGFTRARTAGVDIPLEIVQGALDYLKTVPLESEDQSSPEDEITMLDRLAFIQYALSGVGEADIDQVNQLYQKRAQLNPWAQAMLALTLDSFSADSQQARGLLSELETAAVRSASSAHWEIRADQGGLISAQRNLHTTLSNSAVVLYALAQRDPGSPLVAEAVRYLMAHRSAEGSWESTYTTAWTLMALNEVIKGTGELGGSFTFDATLNNNPIAAGQAGGGEQLTPVTAQVPGQRLYSEYPNALVLGRDSGQGRLYYSAALRASQAADQVEPLAQGLSIEKSFCKVGTSDGECQPIESAQAGERVDVHLMLTLPQDVYYLAVEDYIPAGSEILDLSLLTSQQGEGEEPEAVSLYDPRRPYASGWGWWLFNPSRIYDDHIAWTANHLPAGTYQLTYTLTILQAGEYRVLPARAWQLYFPEVQGYSAGKLFAIEP